MGAADEIDFSGNVEGRDPFHGVADVVVCDGFTGNVVLKVAESVAELLVTWLRRELTGDPVSRVGALLSRPAFRRLRARLDYAEYGGAPLLGVNGSVIIAHRSSSPKALNHPLPTAALAVQHHVNHHPLQ